MSADRSAWGPARRRLITGLSREGGDCSSPPPQLRSPGLGTVRRRRHPPPLPGIPGMYQRDGTRPTWNWASHDRRRERLNLLSGTRTFPGLRSRPFVRRWVVLGGDGNYRPVVQTGSVALCAPGSLPISRGGAPERFRLAAPQPVSAGWCRHQTPLVTAGVGIGRSW